jgi:MFS family permease
MPTSVALAAVSTIGFLGFLLGPPVIGFIAEAFSLRVSFAVVAALGVVSILMARKAR